MADRAYLYSDDRPDAWGAPRSITTTRAGRSRSPGSSSSSPGTSASSTSNTMVRDGRRSGYPPRRIPPWRFERRKPLLMSVIGDRVSGDSVARFVSTCSERPGRYLLLHPDEVLGGINCGFDDDRGHAGRISHILTVLGDGSCTTEVAREITGPYVKALSPDPGQCECQILGYTYW